MKHNDQARENNVFVYECPSENQIKGTKYGNSEGFNLSNTKSGYGTDEFQRQSTMKKGKHDISEQKLHASRLFNRKKHYKFFKREKSLRQKGNIFKFDLAHLLRSDYDFSDLNSVISYLLQRRCSDSNSASTSSESDEDTERRMVGGIEADYDQQNTEFYTQAVSAFRALLESEEALNRIGCSPGIDHDLIYQDFLSDPDRNGVRDPMNVTDDKSTFESGFAESTGFKVTGTGSKHAPTRDHSPFDGGTEISGPNQSSLLRVHDEDQGATGGAPINYVAAKSVKGRTFCVVCKNCIVEVKFKPCGHAVCCNECAIGERKCPACKELILDMADLF